MLDRIDNPHPERLYAVRLTAPEFTSLCPITGQPDFAHMVIDYVPGRYLVESKSFKFFVVSFRNHGAYHEDCTMMVASRMVRTLDPVWLRVAAYWNPRGGIPIDVFHVSGDKPQGVWVPEPGIGPYRPRQAGNCQ